MFSESPADGSTAKQAGVHGATGVALGEVNGGRTPALGRRAGWIAATAPFAQRTIDRHLDPHPDGVWGALDEITRKYNAFRARCTAVSIARHRDVSGKDGRTDAVEVPGHRVGARDERASARHGLFRRGVQRKDSGSAPCRNGKETEGMSNFINRVKGFIRDEEGATATEYAVMLALIIVIALGAISALGDKVSQTFADIEANMP